SPLYYRGRVYAVSNTAVVLNCFDARGGNGLWQQRVEGPFSASPGAADGKAYLVNDAGATTDCKARDPADDLTRHGHEGRASATRALAGRALFLRSERRLC